MDQNFVKSLEWLAEHEGGVTNLKGDSGGLTNLGVTHADYDHYRAWKGLPLRPVTFITTEEAREIYHVFYWSSVYADKLPSGVDNCVFDMAVNNGVTGAIKAAQRVAARLTGSKIAVDGHIGPITLNAICSCNPGEFVESFCNERLRVDSGFSVWPRFGRAWTNRVNGNVKLGISGVRYESLSIIGQSATSKMPVYVQPVSTINIVSKIISAFTSLLAKVLKRT
jgi:lysozyme family protein